MTAAVEDDVQQDECKFGRWCDDQPGHVGGHSRQLGSKTVPRQNGDTVGLSVRVLIDHHNRLVTEVQLDNQLVHLDKADLRWLQTRLRDAQNRMKG